MKDVYKEENLNETLILRIFPDMKEDLNKLVSENPDKYKNVSFAIRAAIYKLIREEAEKNDSLQ